MYYQLSLSTIPIITPDSPDYGKPVYLDKNGEYVDRVTNGIIKVVLMDEEGNLKLNSEENSIYVPGETSKALQGWTLKVRWDNGTIFRARVLLEDRYG